MSAGTVGPLPDLNDEDTQRRIVEAERHRRAQDDREAGYWVDDDPDDRYPRAAA
jgi:hypothetical protein